MGGSSKTTSTTVSNQKNDPWAPAQPALNTALTGAQNAYDTTFQGTGVADLDQLVAMGQGKMVDNAMAGGTSAMAGDASNYLSGILKNGGLSQGQSSAMGGMQGAVNQFGGRMDTAINALTPFATGQGMENPYFAKYVDDAMTQAKNKIDRGFSASGRYASDAHNASLGGALGRIGTEAYANEYARQQGQQLSAIQAMGGMSGNALQGMLGGQGQIAGMGQQGIANTSAITSMLPGLEEAKNIDAQRLANIGAQKMDYEQRLIDAANNNPWARVGNLAEVARGIGSIGGTQSGVSTTTGTQQQSPLQQVMGGVMGGAGALANLGKAGEGFSSLFGPTAVSTSLSGAAGAGAAAGGSGIMSSIMAFLPALFSDERLKENIKPVGKTSDGQNIYAYNYKGDPRPTMGLLAQEVLTHKPHAVHLDSSGYLKVNYADALEDA